MKKPTEYKIETFTDIVNTVNSKNLDAFMADLKGILLMANLAKAAYPSDAKEPLQFDKHYTWKDDGKHKINLDL